MNQKLIIALVMLAALAAGIGVQQLAGNTPPEFNARVFDPVRVIKPFELTNQHGEKVDNSLFDEKWTLIFLGYTHCPDVCPTTLGKLTNSYRKLKAAGIDNIQVLFVSVDPQRDDTARLKEYTEYFHTEFVAASGPHKDLFPFVRNLGLMYSMTEDTSQEEYDVGHSGGIVLVNPQGQLQAMFKPVEAVGKIPNVDMALLEADMQQMVSYF